MFFQPHEITDQKIEQLKNKVDVRLILRHRFDEWEEVFELIKEIKDDLKTVRYPTMNEKNEAWQKFYNLREKAYSEREKDFKNRSDDHLNHIHWKLAGLRYSATEDIVMSVLTFGEMKTTKEDIRNRGKELNEVAKYFSSVKHEMTRDHKAEIHERIVDIRQSHDLFWGEIKSRSEEMAQVKYEKKKAWEERQERRNAAKDRIETNLEKNKEKLEKARAAIERFEGQKSNLEDKIESAYSDNFRERHQEWLSEVEEKISSVEEQIERLEKWIREDEEKLDSWT